MFVGATVLPLLILAFCAPPAHPLVAEIFYDAVGDDTGHEFVELFNPSDMPFALAGARLEAGDGAGAGRWSLRWTGAPRDTIAAGYSGHGFMLAPAISKRLAAAIAGVPTDAMLAEFHLRRFTRTVEVETQVV